MIITRYAVILYRQDGDVEMLSSLWHTEAEARIQADAWIIHCKSKIEVRVIQAAFQVPDSAQGGPSASDPSLCGP
jgi:hypothetical protein